MIRPLLLTLSLLAVAADWSYWRGPERTGVSRETGLPDKVQGNVVFDVPYSGLSSPIVQDGQVYVIGRTGSGETQQECVQAFDALTGKLAWEHKFNVWLTDIVDDRLGFTNLAGDPETGNVYAQTTAGNLFAYDKKGKLLWQHSLTEEFGRVSGYGGRVTFPVVDEDKVIVGMVNASWGEHTVGQTRFVAFDKKTGKIIWWASGGHRVVDTYYSTPTVAVVGGVRTFFSGGGDGCVHAFAVRTGKRLWSHKFGDGAVNCAPVVQGSKVWIGHGEENEGTTQGKLICLDTAEMKDGEPKLVWEVEGVKVKFASPILHDGMIIVCDELGKMYAFDAESGKRLWRFNYGRNTKGSPVWADGKMYITEVDGAFHVLKADKKKCVRISKHEFAPVGTAPTELHGTPAVSDGRIYFTTTNQLMCIGDKGKKGVKVELPEEPKEDKAGTEVAHVQVVPADVTLRPGEKVEFEAIGYDAGGRRIGPVEVEWERAGMRPPVYPIGLTAPKPPPGATAPPQLAGELSEAKGKATAFTAGKVPAQFGQVVARAGKLTGEARVRVAPNLPYSMDFDKVPAGRTPPAWVNTMGKFAAFKLPDGSLVFRKRNDQPSPLVARANAFIGAPGLKDYTVQADVMATRVGGKMADVGVGACRYTLTLSGETQELYLNTWDAQARGRVQKHTAFTFAPDTWYTMKISAAVKDGKGVVKGKMWPRGDKEPEAWTLELTDPVPNESGAPLIYGFANGSTPKGPAPESYFDNVKVTPNGKK